MIRYFSILKLSLIMGCYFAAMSTSFADEPVLRYQLGGGMHNAGPVGAQISVDRGLGNLGAQAHVFRIGVQLESRGYQYRADSLAVKSDLEGQIYYKLILPMNSGLKLVQQTGTGWVRLPGEASQRGFGYVESLFGVGLGDDDGRFELASGIRWQQISAPIQLGDSRLGEKLLPVNSIKYVKSL